MRPLTLQWWRWKLRGDRSAEAAEFLPIAVANCTVPVATPIELETNETKEALDLISEIYVVEREAKEAGIVLPRTLVDGLARRVNDGHQVGHTCARTA